MSIRFFALRCKRKETKMKKTKKKGPGRPKSVPKLAPKADFTKSVPLVLILLLVAAGIVLSVGTGMYLAFHKNTPDTGTPAAFCTPASFENFKLLVQQAGFSEILLQNVSSYAAQGKFVKDYQVTVHTNGQIACGYLYVRARIGGKPLNDAYDSIYITCNDSGGHLMRSQSLAITEALPIGWYPSTEVLYPLDKIPFIPHVPYNPATKNFQYANWVKEINKKGRARFWIGLSTLDPAGWIEEAKLVYTLIPGTAK